MVGNDNSQDNGDRHIAKRTGRVKVKLQNGEIFNSAEPLKKLLDQKFPVKTSYGLAKLANKLNTQLTIIEDVRMGLIKKYGETDEKGRLSVNREGKNWSAFVAEFNELMEQEVELVIEKVKIPEKVAGTCDKCQHNMDRALEIEPNILMALDKLIEVA